MKGLNEDDDGLRGGWGYGSWCFLLIWLEGCKSVKKVWCGVGVVVVIVSELCDDERAPNNIRGKRKVEGTN
jgi:hypothetical protein